jgi:hypothetical protein
MNQAEGLGAEKAGEGAIAESAKNTTGDEKVELIGAAGDRTAHKPRHDATVAKKSDAGAEDLAASIGDGAAPQRLRIWPALHSLHGLHALRTPAPFLSNGAAGGLRVAMQSG